MALRARVPAPPGQPAFTQSQGLAPAGGRLEEMHSLRQRLALPTPRELPVLERVVAGVRSKQIAAELLMSVRTVEIQHSRGLAKLQVKPVLRLAAHWAQL